MNAQLVIDVLKVVIIHKEVIHAHVELDTERVDTIVTVSFIKTIVLYSWIVFKYYLAFYS